MNTTTALRGAVVATVTALALTACGGSGGSGVSGGSGTAGGATSSPSGAAPSGKAASSATPTPTPSPTLHTKIGPLLAVTDALIAKDPSVSFQIADTEGGDPTLDAGGEIIMGKELAARVNIDDYDGFRDLVVLGKRAYINEGEAGSPAWRTTSRQRAEAEIYELAVHRLIPALKAGVTSVTSKGTVEEAGTTLVRYTFTARTQQTLDAMDLEVTDDKTPPTFTGELWLHADSGDLRRVHMVMDDFDHMVDLQFGIAPNIVAPPL